MLEPEPEGGRGVLDGIFGDVKGKYLSLKPLKLLLLLIPIFIYFLLRFGFGVSYPFRAIFRGHHISPDSVQVLLGYIHSLAGRD